MQIRGTWSAGPGDDQARFLADLRALRDSAAIGYDELAARAHYPSDVLKEAENGPYLPGLPILAAYVRACEGDVLDWEERWRHLNPDVVDDPGLPVRPAGASPAAVAGARAGVGVVPPDVYDPERIKAALRGEHAGPGQAGRRANDLGTAAPPQAAADPAVTSANGNHPAEHGHRGPFDTAFTDTAFTDTAFTDTGDSAEEFSWLKKTQAGGLTSPERTDFWSKPATPASADLQPPAAAPRAGEPAIARASWPAAAGTGPATVSATGAQPLGSVRSQPIVTGRDDRHEDRFFPVRLLVVIVIAALVGSALVLLLK